MFSKQITIRHLEGGQYIDVNDTDFKLHVSQQTDVTVPDTDDNGNPIQNPVVIGGNFVLQVDHDIAGSFQYYTENCKTGCKSEKITVLLTVNENLCDREPETSVRVKGVIGNFIVTVNEQDAGTLDITDTNSGTNNIVQTQGGFALGAQLLYNTLPSLNLLVVFTSVNGCVYSGSYVYSGAGNFDETVQLIKQP